MPAAGAVYGGQNANVHNPEGLPKEAVATNLEEAASALPAPTAEQKLQREKDNARILAGELAAISVDGRQGPRMAVLWRNTTEVQVHELKF